MDTRRELGDILVEEHLIAREQLNQARRAAERLGSPLVAVLLEQGLINEESLVEALCSRLHLEVFDPLQTTVDPDAIREVPFEEANRYKLLPLQIQQHPNRRILRVAMVDPLDLQAIEDIECSTGALVEPLIARPSELAEAIRHYYRGMVTKIMARSRPNDSHLPDEFALGQKNNRRYFGEGLDTGNLITKTIPREQEVDDLSIRLEALIALLIQKRLISFADLENQIQMLLRTKKEKK